MSDGGGNEGGGGGDVERAPREPRREMTGEPGEMTEEVIPCGSREAIGRAVQVDPGLTPLGFNAWFQRLNLK